MKKLKIITLLLITFIIPINIFAYSPYITLSGETIGIEVHSKGIYIVGFYDVNNKPIAKKVGFKVGDIITKINNENITDIDSLNNIIKTPSKYTFTVKRNNKEININLNLEEEDSIIKTGLYVKDQLNGIGTLTYIDPKTKIFGSLGHEILESSSLSKFEIKDGSIYKASVDSIKKSEKGLAGEKKANYDKTFTTGNIKSNEQSGIYGKYTYNLSDKDTYEVANPSEIKKGLAQIKTVIKNNKVETFNINIIAINENESVKNILFEITDENLIKETGGVIQGMSGSPIIQNDKVIGAVNYVIIDDTKKGYGIFITTMLTEGDKLLN